MVNLAGGEREIAIGGEMASDRDAILERRHRPWLRSIHVNSRGGRPKSVHDAGARWIADRRMAVRVGEQDATLGEAIDVRCLRVGVSAKAAHPIVEVVDRDQQHVGLGICTSKLQGSQNANTERDRECGNQEISFHAVPQWASDMS